jgi:CDP-4-dehydro-6-deoxyglucose reductase
VIAGEVVKVMPHDYPLSAAERLAGYTLLCAHSAGSGDIVIETLEAHGPGEIPEQELTVRVKRIDPLAADTLLLHVQTPRTQRLRFLAGQSATLYGGSGEVDAQRAYPIASCPCDDRNLHFHVPRDSGDALAQMLFAGTIRAGDPLTLWGPTGEFVLAESERPLAFVACDHGFAPIKSLIEHAMAVEANESISVDWLATTPDGHYLANQCRAWAAAYDDFRFAPHSLADPVAGARAAVAALAAAVRLPERDVYVAGPVAFVDAASAALAETGATAARIFALVV